MGAEAERLICIPVFWVGGGDGVDEGGRAGGRKWSVWGCVVWTCSLAWLWICRKEEEEGRQLGQSGK